MTFTILGWLASRTIALSRPRLPILPGDGRVRFAEISANLLVLKIPPIVGDVISEHSST